MRLLSRRRDTLAKLSFEGGSGNYYREKHWHRSVEIFAVCGGELDFYIDDRKCHLEPDDFMIVNSNEVHAIASPLPMKRSSFRSR